MFDIAWSELLLIAVVALIFIGPKELPALLNNLGRAAAKLRRSADDFRRHFEESMREAGYEDLHKNINDLRSLNPSSQLRATIDSAINQSYAPKAPPAGSQPSAPPSFVNPQGSGQAGQAASEAGAIATASGEGSAGSGKAGDAPASEHGGAAEGEQKSVVEPSKDHAVPVA
jgi:sec-independent protein translocase protein TatB